MPADAYWRRESTNDMAVLKTDFMLQPLSREGRGAAAIATRWQLMV